MGSSDLRRLHSRNRGRAASRTGLGFGCVAESWTRPCPAYIPHSSSQSLSCPVMVSPSHQLALANARVALHGCNRTGPASGQPCCSHAAWSIAMPIVLALSYPCTTSARCHKKCHKAPRCWWYEHSASAEANWCWSSALGRPTVGAASGRCYCWLASLGKKRVELCQGEGGLDPGGVKRWQQTLLPNPMLPR